MESKKQIPRTFSLRSAQFRMARNDKGVGGCGGKRGFDLCKSGAHSG